MIIKKIVRSAREGREERRVVQRKTQSQMILVRMLLEAMSLQPTAMRLQPQGLKRRKKLNEPIGFKIRLLSFPFKLKSIHSSTF